MARKSKIDNVVLKRLKNKEELQRKNKRLPLRKYFLIVCEGTKTEPNYFESYKKLLPPNIINIDVCGTGFNTLNILGKAIELRNLNNNDYKYDEVWIVFDKDSFPDDDFDNTIFKASKNKINFAYSNEAFELWYLLHFDYYNSGISRDQYKAKLNEKLGFIYEKNSPDMFYYLKEKQNIAINNAKRLYSEYDHKSPAKENPSTTVFMLVEELNKYLK